MSRTSTPQFVVYVLSLGFLLTSGYVWWKQTSIKTIDTNLASPQAPLAQDLSIQNISPKIAERKTEKVKKTPKSENLQTDSPIYQIASKGKNIILNTTDPDQPNPTIKILDKKSNQEIASFDPTEVTNVRFADEDTVIYQAQGGETPGVYVQDIGSDNPILVIETTDWSAVDNTLMVDEDTIFFNQPKTGKMGTKDIGGEEKIWDQKLSKSASSYITLTAFKFPTQSPDGKYIAMYDLNPDDPQNPFEAEVRVYDMGGNIYMSARVQLAPRGMSAWEKPLEWIESYLIAGDEKVVFDVEKKSEIYRAEKPVHLKISPDKSKMIQIDQENGDAGVYTIEGKKMFDIEKNIRQAEWIDNNTIMLTIADSIYIYDTNTQKLEKATDSTGFFQIHDVDVSENTAYVSNDTELTKISFN